VIDLEGTEEKERMGRKKAKAMNFYIKVERRRMDL